MNAAVAHRIMTMTDTSSRNSVTRLDSFQAEVALDGSERYRLPRCAAFGTDEVAADTAGHIEGHEGGVVGGVARPVGQA